MNFFLFSFFSNAIVSAQETVMWREKRKSTSKGGGGRKKGGGTREAPGHTHTPREDREDQPGTILGIVHNPVPIMVYVNMLICYFMYFVLLINFAGPISDTCFL